MRGRKGSLWGKKKKEASGKAERVPGGSAPRAAARGAVKALDAIDFSQFYDKVNSRGSVDDLVLLENVSNEGIVEVLRTRCEKGDMYTSIGPVLIAVNPYKQLSMGGKGIYTSGVRDYYHRKGGGDFMAPHIYRVAAEAYKSLQADSRDQCVIVTGESGAGKTEAAKQLMHFVTTVGTSSETQKATMEGVQRHLLESNPILEAFGNAQTIRNDNSSRFGKYMELQFTFKGMLRGGKVTNYLLEKSRVTGQAPGERCFHVMHYLLEGTSARERSDYRLLPANEYAYLMKKDRSIRGIDDGKEFINLKASMSRVDIHPKDQSHLFPLLAGVLAAGNICFEDHGDGNAATVMQTPDKALARTAGCLGVDPAALEAALTSVTLQVGGRGGMGGMRDASSWIGGGSASFQGLSNNRDQQHRNLNGGDAAKSRDAMAKEIYRRLFGWIVDKVNRSIECATEGLTMGILDIYGFEIFDSNDFEQFCINYVNEKLQQYFIDHTIRAEQDDYEAEGVEWEHVDYFNNKTVCDMIEGRHGLLSLLDEVSSYKDNDGKVLVNRYNRVMANHDHYFPGEEAVYGTSYGRRRSSGSVNGFSNANGNNGTGSGKASLKATSSGRAGAGADAVYSRVTVARGDKHFLDAKQMFGIRHFAGNVTYAADRFIEKNADRLHGDVRSLLAKSTNPLAAELFREGARSAGPHNKARRHPSLSAQFKKQVDALCGSLARCRPHYVRCIKPNSTKTPLKVDETMLTHQVTYLGLRENVRVRRQGYAYRMPFEHFVRRYGFLSESTWPDRVTKKFWPDGTPFDPAHPQTPQHLIKHDEVEEEFQELREVEPDSDGSKDKDKESGTTDSSDDGVTDKEAPTPPGQRTPPRAKPPSVARATPARILQNFTPARLRGKAAATPVSTARTSAMAAERDHAPKRMVMVTSTRIRKVPRRVDPVDRTTWERRELSARQATVALLEEGRPKRWESHRTGGKPVTLNVPRLCADSGDIKMGKTKIFIKQPHTLFDLEDQRQPALFAVAVIIQSKARGFVRRWRYVRFQAVIGKVAAVARGFLARQRYYRILGGIERAQAVFRGNKQRVRYKRLKIAAKGRPLRYYALRIQRNYRGYKGRSMVPRRTLKRSRALGAKMLAASRGYRAAVVIQAAWRKHAARKAFMVRRKQTAVVQSFYRRRVARQEFEKMRLEDYKATIKELRGGMTMVKHTVGTSFRRKTKRPIEFTCSNRGVLSWDGLGMMRKEQSVNIASDVLKITKGITSRTLRRTGEAAKGDGVATRTRPGQVNGSGNYLVLHQRSGKTLDLECESYTQRDSVKRALSKIKGEW